MNKNIVLIGMPGCGKSTIGLIVAKKLNINYIDMDEYIMQHEKKSIQEMFEIGEEYFRNAETKCSKLLSSLENHVISTGGGIVKKSENMNALKENSLTFFINRPLENIIEDVNTNTRPLLAEGIQKIYELYDERIHLYRKYCDIEVANSGKISDVAEKIIQCYKKTQA